MFDFGQFNDFGVAFQLDYLLLLFWIFSFYFTDAEFLQAFVVFLSYISGISLSNEWTINQVFVSSVHF